MEKVGVPGRIHADTERTCKLTWKAPAGRWVWADLLWAHGVDHGPSDSIVSGGTVVQWLKLLAVLKWLNLYFLSLNIYLNIQLGM